ncbi:glycine betaine ABC transporter substrate-binding protein [Fervidibacillus albus]|uniref:ABC transporter permease subunit n=1 Tax=Fervidibacillus albus TaxID=2980026 RepID=A0A9E8LX81_9BACI|nr:glycine betaine ABC transporter substrate-binding protein [Fervidibacillus albus]WAA11000.1 ABC transporter permease subunit [Fervidibacillus albus]
MNELMSYVSANYEQILDLLWQHIYLTFFSVFVAAVIGVPLGILISRSKALSKPVIGFANVVQAVPSLALLGFLIPFIGIGSTPAIVMVVLYSLLPIVKNTYTGLTNIDKDILEAARGIGLTNGQMMTKVQLPLAMPVIMAGVRISAVTAVGLMTIAAFVGAGGLGFLVFSGVSSVDNNMILAGAIPACILALLIDYAVGKIEKNISYTNKKYGSTITDGKRKRRNITIAAASVLILVIAVVLIVNPFSKNEKTISIGSKNYTEQILLGHIFAELIEAQTDIKVERDLNLGGTQVAFLALTNDEIDLYIEYTGTLFVDVLDQPPISDQEKVYNTVKTELMGKYDVETLDPLGFNNTYTLAVRGDTAEQYNLETFSDLAAVSDQLRVGGTIEFLNREDGLKGLIETYGMNFQSTNAVNGGLRYNAINNDEVDVISAFATDGLLEEFKLTVLKDDQSFFPPYYAVPIVRSETLKQYPELKEVLNLLAGKMTDDKMRELNFRVDSLKESPQDVARDFLKEEGLLN